MENYLLMQPHRLTDFYARYLMTDGGWTIEEKLLELPCEFECPNSVFAGWNLYFFSGYG